MFQSCNNRKNYRNMKYLFSSLVYKVLIIKKKIE